MSARTCLPHPPGAYVSLRQPTSAYVSLRQPTSAFVSLRQPSSAYISMTFSSPPAASFDNAFFKGIQIVCERRHPPHECSYVRVIGKNMYKKGHAYDVHLRVGGWVGGGWVGAYVYLSLCLSTNIYSLSTNLYSLSTNRVCVCARARACVRACVCVYLYNTYICI